MLTVRQTLVGLGCVAGAVLLVLLPHRNDMESTTTPTPHEVTPSIAITPEISVSVAEQPTEKPAITILPFATELEKDLIRNNNPESNRQAVDQILIFYRKMFGENPVGQNEEITAALLGENKERVAFIPPDSAAIKDGKLVDAWETPYWFHALSGQHMEIHSAGPDQKLFTADDLPGTDQQQHESLPSE